jgi:cell division septum initiation protein DivIVA
MARDDEVTDEAPGLPLRSITDHRFTQVRWGDDPAEVRLFLAGVAQQLARLQARNDELAARLARAEAQAAGRRQAATARIDQLRAGRQRLLEAYAGVRRTLDDVHEELRRAAADGIEAGVADPAVAEDPVAEDPVAEAPVVVEPRAGAGGAPAARDRRAAELGAGDPVPTGPRPEVVHSDDDELELQRREAELEGLVAGMAQRWKRILQDEHNDLLDRLRRVPGPHRSAEVLGRQVDQVERYGSAARPFVEQAAAAGVRFALRATPGPGASRPDVIAGVSGPALADVVGAFVVPLRQRVDAVLAERGADAVDVLAAALASVYRETRSQRIESLTTDVLSAAHAEATWRAAPAGSALRWIAEDADGPCPDCDDNALAGPVARGQAFPTGQLHPPAHRGCRCLLVLDDA